MFFNFVRNFVDHSIYPKHYHSDKRNAKHQYDKCINKAKTNSEKQICKNEKDKVFKDGKKYEGKDYNKDDSSLDWDIRSEYKKKELYNCIEQKIEIKKNAIISNCKDDDCKSYNTDKYNKMLLCNNSKQENICKSNNDYKKLYYNCEKKKKSENGFIDVILDIIAKGNPFEKIYYCFTLFSVLLFFGIFIWILWYFFVVFNYLIRRHIYKTENNSLPDIKFPVFREGKFLSNNFPGPFIYGPVEKYFQYFHFYFIQFVLLIWAGLFFVIILLYFFKKMFGWWPASWVWDSIGLFKGSEPCFNWIDSLFGCTVSGGPVYCNAQAIWNLMEDWIVYTCKKGKKVCGNKTEEEIRAAINAFKDIEGFTNNNHCNNNDINLNLYKKDNYIENFSFLNNLDNVTNKFNNFKNKFNDSLDRDIAKYDEEGDKGTKEKESYDESKKDKDDE